MSKLDDIFGRQYDKRLLVSVARPMKQEIKDLMLEIIGEDDIKESYNEYSREIAGYMNTVRQLLRRKVDEL